MIAEVVQCQGKALSQRRSFDWIVLEVESSWSYTYLLI
jgi:hypothetical protein